MPLVVTQARIAASPERVFAVLADFARYGDWNPLNLAMTGEARLGAPLALTVRNPLDGKSTALTARVSRLEPARALEWSGGVPLLFEGRHFFELSADGAATLLRHGEDMRGLLPALWGAKTIDTRFVPAYAAVNDALAKRVEALQ